MKVAAKHRLNYSGAWYEAGEEFEIGQDVLPSIEEFVRPVGYVSAVFPPEVNEDKPRRKRKKTET